MTRIAVVTPFRVVLLFVIAAVAGVLALPGLPVNLLPVQKSSQLQVSYSVPNSSPATTEQQATAVLEGACSQLSQLKKISSVSEYNNGNITLEFDKSANMQFKQFELAALLRRVYDQLPAGVSYPLITGGNSEKNSNTPFLVYTVNAPQQAFAIKKQAENVFGKALSLLRGISNISVSGTEQLQVTIQYDRHKCLAWGMEPAVINASLQAYSSVSFPGSLGTANGEQFFLRIPSMVNSLHDIENILLVNDLQQTLSLKDIAKVYIEEQEASGYFRINGKSSVSVSICAHDGENKIALAKQVKNVIRHAAGQLPKEFAISVAYDDTAFLEKEMQKNYSRTGLSMVILIFFILIAYLSWRYLLVLFSSLLVNLSLTAILIYLFGVQIHLYTIAGLAIAFGIMTDNSIVMIDYYHQWRNRQVFLALLASTLTIVVALSLVFFLPEEDRNNLADFSLIIVLALASSMLVALWFTPGLYVLVHAGTGNAARKKTSPGQLRLIHKASAYYYNIIERIARFRSLFITGLVLLFGLPVFMLPNRWEGDQWYHRWYNASIGTEYYQENIRPVADKWLGGSLRLFVNDVYEKSGYRSPEKTRLYVNAELPYGHTVEQMNVILMDFEKYLSAVDGIDKYFTNIYSGQSGIIEISFKEGYDQSGLPFQLKSKLIARSLDWGGVEWRVYGVGQGFSNAGNDEIPSFRVMMKGYNYDELEKQANRLAAKLLRYQRIQKVNTNERTDDGRKQSREFVLQTDPTIMTLAGTNRLEVFQHVAALSKPAAAEQYITLDNRYYPVMLKENGSEKFSAYHLLNDPLALDSNRLVRLRDFSTMTLQSTANSIQKEDRQYIRVVSFEYMGSAQFGNKYLDEVLAEMKQEMPVGYTAVKNSRNWDWGKTKRSYFLIIILILANFFICSILFENLKKPFYIIAMIPVSFIGLFLTFSIGDFYFDQGGYAAFVMLGGLVVNAAIFIVNDLNNLRKHFPQRCCSKLLVKATVTRSRTVLLTTISACCGLVPFLIEGQNEVFWFALAVGTMGGLLFSLFAVFIVLPVLLWRRGNKK